MKTKLSAATLQISGLVMFHKSLIPFPLPTKTSSVLQNTILNFLPFYKRKMSYSANAELITEHSKNVKQNVEALELSGLLELSSQHERGCLVTGSPNSVGVLWTLN